MAPKSRKGESAAAANGGGDAGDDLMAWVVKSRKLDEKRRAEKEKAERMARMLADQDDAAAEDEEDEDDEGSRQRSGRAAYTSRDLAGLKVRHGVSKVLEEGAAVVLTLKDSSILAGGDINQEEDELENVELAEQSRRDAAYRAAKKTTSIADKFAEDEGVKKPMLPQYDDGQGDDEGIVLDGLGGLDEATRNRLDEVRTRLHAAATALPSAPHALGSTIFGGGPDGTSFAGPKVASDFLTEEEMEQRRAAAQQFRKPKKKKKIRRRTGGVEEDEEGEGGGGGGEGGGGVGKKKRKKEKLDLDKLEAQARAAGLGRGSDLGRRDGEGGTALTARRREEQEREERGVRAAYESAKAKALEASRVLKEGGGEERGGGEEGRGYVREGMEVDEREGGEGGGEEGREGKGVKKEEVEEAGEEKGEKGGETGRADEEEEEEEEDTVVIGDDDEDLQRSLERARLLALRRRQEEEAAARAAAAANGGGDGDGGTGKVKQEADMEGGSAAGGAGARPAVRGEALVLAQLKQVGRGRKRAGEGQGGEEEEEGSARGLVFSDTGEFCRGLQLDDALVKRVSAREAAAAAKEELAAAAAAELLPSSAAAAAAAAAGGGGGGTRSDGGGWMEVKRDGEDEEMGDAHEGGEGGEGAGEREAEKGKGKAEKEEVDAIAETPVGVGLAAALALLKDRGALKGEVEWGGRTMDKKRSKLVGVLDEHGRDRPDAFKDVRIDRLDEFGRVMTPKEAFRKLSHAFHGKGPGKMKQEKRIRAYEEDLKRKGMAAGDTPMHSVEKLREVQRTTQSPYVVITGHVKPGQITDPANSFATMEKETVGSLTPMLGDKKVEYFLGISKPSSDPSPSGAASSRTPMGPPRPKNPKQ
ncbi:hypothetical protein CLOM_g21337 [Closterium sp. NIES-68]|nr:hypothetical protein CLOM_g21337 [Closterium sp. NIES-68]GJP71922.1 hypothetical protein CLOP_g2710 [Closterium sp. NIES-67]